VETPPPDVPVRAAQDPESGPSDQRLPISVVIPSYNRAHELPQCLASVWAQAPARPLEVIVVDDGSVDDTRDVAERLGATVVRHSENRGLPAARNTGLEQASCDWIAFLDSDDQWLANHLAHAWNLRDGHVLVGTSALRCGEDPRYDRFHGPITRSPLVLHSPALLAATYNMFTISGVLMRRDAALALGGFRPLLSEDLDMWVRLLEQTPNTAIASPEVTVVYQLHANQMSADGHRMLESHRFIVEDHCRRSRASRRLVQRWAGVSAYDSLRLALSEHRRADAVRAGASLLGNPDRLVGLAKLLRIRLALSRRATTVSRSGAPTVALTVGNGPERREILRSLDSLDSLDSLPRPAVRDLSSLPAARRMLTLIRRPAGVVLVGSRRSARLMRLLGINAVAVQDRPR
jgi:hypothetical protein